jgi:RNA polymerase sigma-70 factor (ECF subfamily)
MSVQKHIIDTSAWVDDYSDMLFNYAKIRVNDHDLAMDLVQDTFVSGLKALDKFEQKSSIKTWLFAILKRKIIDHWRKQEVRKTNPFSFFKTDGIMKGGFLDGHQPQGKLNEIEAKIENQELKAAIANCIAALPDKWKGIVIGKLVDEQKSEEVCQEFDVTPANLWVIIHRAKVQLRDCLENKWLTE